MVLPDSEQIRWEDGRMYVKYFVQCLVNRNYSLLGDDNKKDWMKHTERKRFLEPVTRHEQGHRYSNMKLI